MSAHRESGILHRGGFALVARMKVLYFLLLAGVASAQPLNLQLRELARGADRVELTWRPELGVEVAGIVPLKKVYRNDAADELLFRLVFVDDLPNEETPPMPPDVVVIPKTNCCCLAAGMDDYLSKPTRVEDVKAALARSVAAAAGHAA